MVPAGIRTIVVPSGTNGPLSAVTLAPAYYWPVAEPDDILDYYLDVAAPLAAVGDTLASAAVTVTPVGALAATGMTVGPGGLIAMSLSGGVAGQAYVIRIDALAAGGQPYVWLIGVLIDPAGA